MIAIRGATTVNSDTQELIKNAVTELLSEIKNRNGLNNSQIVGIIISSTQDIHSFYPAKAAREAGFDDVALFSAAEPAIDGALPLCIRVMALCDTDAKPVHVYLHRAAKLRKDLTEKIVIALDGPSGCGKSTTAKALAKHFNILYLDTGAMYRACALKCIMQRVNLDNEEQVSSIINDIDLKIRYEDGKQLTILDNFDVSDNIRTDTISEGASKVSVYPAVRQKMVQMQKKIASEISCVVDGRDIGTNVLPDAKHKFYLTASPEVRAKRRYTELKLRNQEVTIEQVISDMAIRDERDFNRQLDPLKCAPDAIKIDNSNLNIQQTVDLIISKIQEKI